MSYIPRPDLTVAGRRLGCGAGAAGDNGTSAVHRRHGALVSLPFILFTVWLVLAAVIGAVWLFRLGFVTLVWDRSYVVGPGSHRDDAAFTGVNLPRVSVLVAAKDEEDNIERCVTSLLGQDYPDFEVVVIDDRSQDGTPRVLGGLAARSGVDAMGRPRLRVVTIDELPAGWCGKNHAMRAGVAAASGEWFVFTDADCRMTSQRALSVAVRESLVHEVDFLSIIPFLETPTAWEKVLQPACAMLLILWFLPHRVNDPARKTAYANGAFMLLRRACYTGIGGHERVRLEVNEDVKMARFAKRSGFRLRVVENDDLYRTRMYRTPRQAWRGWSRILFGCLGTLRRLAISAAVVLVYTVLPWASLGAALIGLGLAGPDSAAYWSWAVAGWAGVVTAEQAALWQIYRGIHVPGLWSLAHVIGAIATVGMLVSASLKVVGATGTEWRGTRYRACRADARALPASVAGTHPPSIERVSQETNGTGP